MFENLSPERVALFAASIVVFMVLVGLLWSTRAYLRNAEDTMRIDEMAKERLAVMPPIEGTKFYVLHKKSAAEPAEIVGPGGDSFREALDLALLDVYAGMLVPQVPPAKEEKSIVHNIPREKVEQHASKNVVSGPAEKQWTHRRT